MVNRADLGELAVEEKNRPLGCNPFSIPSLGLNSAGHRVTKMPLDEFVLFDWWMDSSFVFTFICLLSVAAVFLLIAEASLPTHTAAMENRWTRCVCVYHSPWS